MFEGPLQPCLLTYPYFHSEIFTKRDNSRSIFFLDFYQGFLHSCPAGLKISLKYIKQLRLMDWLDWHLLCQIMTELDQSLQIFPPFCSLVSLLMPARCLRYTSWKSEKSVWLPMFQQVKTWNIKVPSSFLQTTGTNPDPCLHFFAVSNLVQSSRHQAGVIWLQSSQSIENLSWRFLFSSIHTVENVANHLSN